ncbi:hypothetical protein V5O48_013127 [Marasmius crinis-equi]|uniref:DUF6593 domain-containing protein n=1 Tax=Marasmius crinis-equi TaxID=585013 RepID=A0ABR3F0W4_9AGAR
MELIFSKTSARNATLSLPSGQPVYELSTPSRLLHTEQTTITKFYPGNPPVTIGLVEMHSFHDDVCQLAGRNVLPKSDGFWKSGMTFTSSNGEHYTWKRKSDAALLSDKFKHNIAIYEESHSGFLSGTPSPAKLSVAPEGMGILDEIMVTFVYIEQQEQQSRAASASGASAGAAAAAASG